MDRYQFKAQADKWRDDLILLAVLIALALFATGCASIGHERVEGWPQLEIVEHYVAHHEMRNRCSLYAALGSSPEACAVFSFSTARCDIWLSADFPPASYVVAHERQHCAGYSHIGDNSMKSMLANYRGK
jgi:hypothetical protein